MLFSLIQFLLQKFQLRKDPRIKIEYPTMKFFDNKFFLPTHFYGVQPGGPLGIESIDMVHFVYQIPAYNEVIFTATALV